MNKRKLYFLLAFILIIYLFSNCNCFNMRENVQAANKEKSNNPMTEFENGSYILHTNTYDIELKIGMQYDEIINYLEQHRITYSLETWYYNAGDWYEWAGRLLANEHIIVSTKEFTLYFEAINSEKQLVKYRILDKILLQKKV